MRVGRWLPDSYRLGEYAAPFIGSKRRGGLLEPAIFMCTFQNQLVATVLVLAR